MTDDIQGRIGGLGHETEEGLVYYDLGDPKAPARFRNTGFVVIMVILIAYTFLRKWVYDQYGIELTYVYLMVIIFLLAAIAYQVFTRRRKRQIIEAAKPFIWLNAAGIQVKDHRVQWKNLKEMYWLKERRDGDLTIYLVLNDRRFKIPRGMFSDPTYFIDRVERYWGKRPETRED